MRRSIVVVVLFAAFTLGAQPRLPEGDSDAWARVSPERCEIALVHQLGKMGLATGTATLIRQDVAATSQHASAARVGKWVTAEQPMKSSGLPPNPRLQRTPPASPPSPLSCQPLGPLSRTQA